MFKPLDSQPKVFMKLVVEKASQKILGAHMVGPDSAEIVQGIAIALKVIAFPRQPCFASSLGHPALLFFALPITAH